MCKRDLIKKNSPKKNCISRFLNFNSMRHVDDQKEFLEEHLTELKAIQQKLKRLR